MNKNTDFTPDCEILACRIIFFPSNKTQQTSSLGKQRTSLSVRFLVSGAGTWTTELLGLTASRIGYQQATVVVDEDVLNLLLGGFINIYI